MRCSITILSLGETGSLGMDCFAIDNIDLTPMGLQSRIMQETCLGFIIMDPKPFPYLVPAKVHVAVEVCFDHSRGISSGLETGKGMGRLVVKMIEKDVFFRIKNLVKIRDASQLGGDFKYFYFHSYLGKIPVLANTFSDGLNPPTRQSHNIFTDMVGFGDETWI